MGARSSLAAILAFTALAPLAAQANYPGEPEPELFAYHFIGMPQIPIAPYGTEQTALKVGDMPMFHAAVHSNYNPPPDISADLSALGAAPATASSSWLGYSDMTHYPSYWADFPLVVAAGTSDGMKDIPMMSVDALGSVATATAHIIVDNELPTITLTNLRFSAAPPGEGDLMYLSGHVDGTGSLPKAASVSETLLDASGNPMPRAFQGVHAVYDPQTLNAAFAASGDGTFTDVPFVLDEGGGSVPIAPAASFKLAVTVYDEAGNIASTTITVPVPQAATTTTATTTAGVSNVLFLPAIEASRLYRPAGAGETKLWEPGLFDTLHDLYLTPDGKSARGDVYAKTGDVIREAPVTGANIYKSFFARMDSLVTAGTINDWEADPYDWRLSLDDILSHGSQTGSHISYLDATSTPYLIQELKRLAASSKTGKVTIIAHSNGGLVAKRLTEYLGPEASTLIDKIIFVGVPQAGTPLTVAADLHGYDQAFGGGFVVSRATSRTFASTSPAAYQLLPSASYFTQVDDPIISFDPSLPDWIARYGAVIHSAPLLHTFLTDTFGRVDAQTGDINQPIRLSDTLLSNAEALHSDLDNWTPPAGVKLIQIAGWGVPTTVSGIVYKKKDAVAHAEANFTIDGDGVVVVPSALWTSTATGAMDYWVDLKQYSNDHWFVTLGGLLPFNHVNIFETDPVLNFISDQVASTTKPLAGYTYLSTEAPPATSLRLRYALHSPLTLNLYDSQGRHTGVSTSTGQVEEQIPGTYYTEFGDVKYVFTDISSSVRVVMNGYAAGTFTFNVDEYSGDTLTASTTFKDIPTTASTTVSLTTQADLTTLSPMQVDEDGNGTVDASLTPRLNGVVTFPLAYRFDGFLQPVNDTAHQVGVSQSVFKGGSTVPVKFQLKTFDGTPIQAATTPLWLPPQKAGAMSASVDESAYVDPGTSGTVYKWDSTAKQYVYNWSTKGLAVGYWYQVYAKLDDGHTYSVTIGLK